MLKCEPKSVIFVREGKKMNSFFGVHSINELKWPHRVLRLTLLLLHSEYMQCILDLQYNPLLLI